MKRGAAQDEQETANLRPTMGRGLRAARAVRRSTYGPIAQLISQRIRGTRLVLRGVRGPVLGGGLLMEVTNLTKVVITSGRGETRRERHGPPSEKRLASRCCAVCRPSRYVVTATRFGQQGRVRLKEAAVHFYCHY